MCHFHSKAVISEKDVSDTGDQYACAGALRLRLFVVRGQQLYLRRIEEKAMTGLTHHSQIASRIIIEHDTYVALALVVLFDALDGRDLPLERDIQNVASASAGAGERDRLCAPTTPADLDAVEQTPFPREAATPTLSLHFLLMTRDASPAEHHEAS